MVPRSTAHPVGADPGRSAPPPGNLGRLLIGSESLLAYARLRYAASPQSNCGPWSSRSRRPQSVSARWASSSGRRRPPVRGAPTKSRRVVVKNVDRRTLHLSSPNSADKNPMTMLLLSEALRVLECHAQTPQPWYRRAVPIEHGGFSEDWVVRGVCRTEPKADRLGSPRRLRSPRAVGTLAWV